MLVSKQSLRRVFFSGISRQRTRPEIFRKETHAHRARQRLWILRKECIWDMAQMTGLNYKIQEMAHRIRELREIENFTIAEMANKTGVT